MMSRKSPGLEDKCLFLVLALPLTCCVILDKSFSLYVLRFSVCQMVELDYRIPKDPYRVPRRKKVKTKFRRPCISRLDIRIMKC